MITRIFSIAKKKRTLNADSLRTGQEVICQHLMEPKSYANIFVSTYGAGRLAIRNE
jgi:hypothetical protein